MCELDVESSSGIELLGSWLSGVLSLALYALDLANAWSFDWALALSLGAGVLVLLREGRGSRFLGVGPPKRFERIDLRRCGFSENPDGTF